MIFMVLFKLINIHKIGNHLDLFLNIKKSLNFSKYKVLEIKNLNLNKVIKINVKNKKFDPNFHQAMSEIEDDKFEPGTILQELQVGYMLADRLLRPSLVSVSKKKSTKKEENKDKKEAK